MIAIVDYGVGNLFSLSRSLEAIGQEVLVTGEAEALRRADRLILPGVGAFADAATKLRESGLGEVVSQEAARGKPLLGICLGMQLLFEKSYEFGEHEGLGLIPGAVRPIADAIPRGLKIPHIGWNGLLFPGERPRHPLMAGLAPGDCVYFVHSFYAADCEEDIIAVTEYGGILTAAVARRNVVGFQFHPEKSGPVGLQLLRRFCEEGF
ncbi:MAG: hisH1 [Firmicutes bacterium]|nr:hisH1 [Bacillota bacterium]